MNARDILVSAREIVAQGWTRGSLEKDGRCCSVGAVAKAATGNACAYLMSVEANTALNYLAEAMDENSTRFRGAIATVVRFNDNSKSKRRVLQAFDTAIAKLS